MFNIGDIKIKNKVVIAPMAGVSNIAFRTIMKEFGAGLIYAEMVSDKALTFRNEKTHKMIKVLDYVFLRDMSLYKLLFTT